MNVTLGGISRTLLVTVPPTHPAPRHLAGKALRRIRWPIRPGVGRPADLLVAPLCGHVVRAPALCGPRYATLDRT